MDIRRNMMGVIANMAGARMASGEFTHTSGVAYLNHNLNSKKIVVVMQRINSDHSNINVTSQYQSVMIFGATVEALQLDETQTYSLNGGTQAHFDSTNETVNGVYPKGINSFFPSATQEYPQNGVMAYAMRGVEARDASGASDNTVRIYPTYGLTAGRWVWRCYALD